MYDLYEYYTPCIQRRNPKKFAISAYRIAKSLPTCVIVFPQSREYTFVMNIKKRANFEPATNFEQDIRKREAQDKLVSLTSWAAKSPDQRSPETIRKLYICINQQGSKYSFFLYRNRIIDEVLNISQDFIDSFTSLLLTLDRRKRQPQERRAATPPFLLPAASPEP